MEGDLGEDCAEPVVPMDNLIAGVLRHSAALLRLVCVARRDAIEEPLDRHFQRSRVRRSDGGVAA